MSATAGYGSEPRTEVQDRRRHVSQPVRDDTPLLSKEAGIGHQVRHGLAVELGRLD